MRRREKVGRKHGIIREDRTQVGTLTMIGIRGDRISVGPKNKRGERTLRGEAKKSTRPEAQGIRGMTNYGIKDQSRGSWKIRGGTNDKGALMITISGQQGGETTATRGRSNRCKNKDRALVLEKR